MHPTESAELAAARQNNIGFRSTPNTAEQTEAVPPSIAHHFHLR